MRTSNQYGPIDTKEWAKEVIKTEHLYTNNPYPEASRPSGTRPYGVSDQYIILDSFNKVESSDTLNGEFKWNFSIQGSTTQDNVGVRDKMDNVIEIQIGEFTIPNIQEVPYILNPVPAIVPSGTDQLVLLHNNANIDSPQLLASQYPPIVPAVLTPFTPWIFNPYTQVPFDRLTVQIKEAGLQSYSDKNGARHHFECAITNNSNCNFINAIPSDNWDTFVFTDPLKDIHGLTLSFRNPDYPISFLPDRINCIIESDLSLAPGPYIRLNLPGHSLLVGDRVFITGCKSGNFNLDRYVNRKEGHVASGSPGVPLPNSTPIATNYIYLDPVISIIDLTSPIPTLPQMVVLYVAKRRIRIPMRIRRVIDRLTNYIVPI